MDKPTALQLIEINKRFYESVSESFHLTRRSAWPGWYELLPLISKYKPLKIADLGCGNGRFFQFLNERGLVFDQAVGYDNDNNLIEKSKMRDLVNVQYEVIDIFENLPLIPQMAFKPTITTAFGVIHHIPGRKNRLEWVRSMVNNTLLGGLVVISLWRIPKPKQVNNIYKDLTQEFEPGDDDVLFP